MKARKLRFKITSSGPKIKVMEKGFGIGCYEGHGEDDE